ncbi:MAG: hypothetical protein IPO18_04105 [bacterium]|nr:hypothetical protein [bacterium]
MSRSTKCPLVPAVLAAAVWLLAVAPAATAVEVFAGWALADVGLHDDRGGPVVGLASRTPLAPATLDLVYGLEYVQKRGSQPTWFADPLTGFTEADAEVTLHVVQPVALLELAVLPPAMPRPYAGLSVALKLAESWSDFPGEPSTEWGYKDVDFAAHFGLAQGVGPLLLDLRYSRGLTGQLVVDPGATAGAKAEDPLPGVSEPVAGAHISLWQLAARVAF